MALVQPKTGRHHQIRKHSQIIGHPVAGDNEHGNRYLFRYWRENKNCPRLLLHCLSITFSFISPTTGEEVTLAVFSAVPDDLKTSIENQPWYESHKNNLGGLSTSSFYGSSPLVFPSMAPNFNIKLQSNERPKRSQ